MKIRLKAIQGFTLEEFKKLKNIKRANERNKKTGEIYLNDEFECDINMANYLLGKNDKHKIVVRVLEIIPAKKK